MNPVRQNIQSLQDAFAFFSVDAVDLAPASHRTGCIREFSRALTSTVARPEMQPLAPELLKIGNQWLLLCQEFVHNPETLSDIGAGRLKKIGSRLLALADKE